MTLRWYGKLRVAVGSRESVITLPTGTTLRDLPPLLLPEYGEELFRLLGGQEAFRQVRILVNGRDHFTRQGLDTVLGEGDTVTLMPPMIGGG